MADVGVARDPGRLPWLEPYRAPTLRKPSNRRSGISAAIGAAGLAAVVTLLTRDMAPQAKDPTRPAQASAILPAPEDLQPQIVLPPLNPQPRPVQVVHQESIRPARPPRQTRGRIEAIPTAAAYRGVVESQAAEASAREAVPVAPTVAVVPVAVNPPPPVINPAARLVRGKTVQMGVYLTAGQAEAAWRRAIRDYTFLVTMPKNIQPIWIRSKRFYRLQLGTPSTVHARQLCGHLKTTGRACTVA